MPNKTVTERIRKPRKDRTLVDKYMNSELVKEQDEKDECLTRPTVIALRFSGKSNDKPLEYGFLIDKNTPIETYWRLLHSDSPEHTLILTSVHPETPDF